ncbi:hypothetical protein HELRODRAFT_87327, partial [Helobdella robusta]|uniref:F-box/LRR-repeat protein 15-like leucin rich repeat domain-containing protein n=1 Tax=Helobdella robusta TaxID=6412 RepID=T1G6P1_HELRO
ISPLLQNEKFLLKFFRHFSPLQFGSLAQVCSTWRDVLYNRPEFWSDIVPVINFRDSQQTNEQTRCKLYSSFQRRKFDSLILIGLSNTDVIDLNRNFSYCRSGVRRLAIRHTNISDRSLKQLIELVSHVTELELTGCNEVTEAGLWGCLVPRLTKLTLADCINVADDSLGAVSQLLPNLRELNLQAYHVTDTALTMFSTRQSSNLKALRLLSCWEISNHGVVNVIRSLPNLTTLSLSGCTKVTDDGVEVVAENLRQLRTLDLSWCSRITDASLECIACDLNLLEELVLDRCTHVSDVGVGFLATMTSLQRLYLRWCGLVRDFSLQHIFSMRNLQVLSVAGCNLITAAGVAGASQLTTLRELELTNSSVLASAELVQYLHESLPGCVIIQ